MFGILDIIVPNLKVVWYEYFLLILHQCGVETLHNGLITYFIDYQHIRDIGWQEVGWTSCSIDSKIYVLLLKIPVSYISKDFLGLFGQSRAFLSEDEGVQVCYKEITNQRV
jgi:hypothetical protein